MREIGKQIATSMFCGVTRKKIIKDMLSELRGGSYPDKPTLSLKLKMLLDLCSLIVDV